MVLEAREAPAPGSAGLGGWVTGSGDFVAAVCKGGDTVSEYVRYLTWVLQGRCQICGAFSDGRQLCRDCEEEINRVAEEVA